MLPPVLLSFGYDKTMLATRSMVLRRAGYSVEEVTRWSDAYRRAQSDVVDALLICHTVPLNEQGILVSAVRANRRLLPIFFVSSQYGHPTTIEGCTPIGKDSARLLKALHVAFRRSQTTLSSSTAA
jgi:DNA-binding response OmpR family regulator